MRSLLLLLGGLAVGAGLASGAWLLLGSDQAAAAEASVASGTVFEDADGDGEQGDGEQGLAGVTVLVDTGDETLRVLTSPEGTYRVELPVEAFTISVEVSSLPAGSWQLTSGRQEYDLNVPSGFVATSVDFGFAEVEPARASGTVYEDLDGDGSRGEDEPGLEGVSVRVVHDETGEVVTVTTDAQGRFVFEATPVDHRVSVEVPSLPAGSWQLTSGRQEYDLNVPSGFVATSVDFGFAEVEPARASGTVYEDLDGDGSRGEDEPGLEGVSVRVVHDETGEVVTVTTDAQGRFVFEATPVDHRVSVEVPSLPAGSWQLTSGRQEYDLNVPSGFVATSVDFGFAEVEPARASGTVYEDLDGDGSRGEDEPGLEGVSVRVVHDETGEVVTVTTDAQGRFVFEATPVDHRVSVEVPSLPAGSWQLTSGRQEYDLNVPSGFVATSVDFGFQQVGPSMASGVVFEDLDGDGEQGGDEPGLSGVTVVVTAMGPGGRTVEVETDGDGRWSSDGLTGPHTAHVDPSSLPQREGLIPAQTSQPQVHALDIAAGAEQEGVDFGFSFVPPPQAGGTSSSGGGDDEPEREPSEPSPSPTEDAAPPDECDLVGTWDLREQPFLDQISAAASAGAPTSMSAEHVSGNYLIELREDGTYTATRGNWSFRISAPEGTVRVTIDAVDDGTWSATEDEISIQEPSGVADVEFGIEQGGQVVPLPVPPSDSVGTEAIAGTGSYTCTGDVLEVTFEGVTSTMDRVG